MPKNKGKGGKNRKRGKNEADDEKRELVFKEDGQEYAQVARMLGNGRCEAQCIDGTKRLCHIRGKMHKKVWIAAGDIALVGLRDYQDDKADVILKYMNDEARLLKAYGELPDTLRPTRASTSTGPRTAATTTTTSSSRTRTSTRSKLFSLSPQLQFTCYVLINSYVWYYVGWLLWIVWLPVSSCDMRYCVMV